MESKKGWVVFVKEKSPAWEVFTRTTKTKLRPGSIVPVTNEELESLSKDIFCLELWT